MKPDATTGIGEEARLVLRFTWQAGLAFALLVLFLAWWG